MPSVETARGALDTGDLGPMLMHEHVLNVTAEVAVDQPRMSWGEGEEAVIERCVARLREIEAVGIRSILDATALGHGRSVGTLQKIAAQVDLNILSCTGIYTYDQLPFFFEFRRPGSSSADDVMIELFVRDITEGIAGTGIRAAAIKCATDVAGVTPGIERVLRAVAAAHRETGAPITTHTDVASRNGLDQQRVFREEGVDLSRVIIGHSGDSQDLDYLRELMDAGSTIGADRFGMYLPDWPTFEQRVETVAQLCALGYADRIVLSHDYTIHTDWQPPGAFDQYTRWVQTHVSEEVLPALRERGVCEVDIESMLVTNPCRIFEHQGAY